MIARSLPAEAADRPAQLIITALRAWRKGEYRCRKRETCTI